MNADFSVMVNTQEISGLGEKRVAIYPTCPDKNGKFEPTRVAVRVTHGDAEGHITEETILVLTKSETRALASAMMGCAAEL